MAKRTKEQLREYSKKYYWEHREERLAYNKKYHKEHSKERQIYKNNNKEKIKNQTLKRLYGLTIEQHESIYVAQRGCCELCNSPLNYDDAHTDHNHLTGSVRALLCQVCNMALGGFYIDEKGTELLVKAIEYVNKYQNI